MMKVSPKKAHPKKEDFLQGLKEGFLYAFNFAPIKYILFLVSLVSLTGMSYAILMPIFAKEILKGGPKTRGFLMGASGIGALSGTIYLAAWKDPRGLEKMISKATFIFGAGLIAFSFSRQLWLSLLLMLCVGFGMIIQMAAGNTILQALTDDDKRGRVMSLFAMAFLGMAPLGSLLAGALASKIGAANVLVLSGLFCILGAFLFSRKDSCYEQYWK
jgi:MFS family permease